MLFRSATAAMVSNREQRPGGAGAIGFEGPSPRPEVAGDRSPAWLRYADAAHDPRRWPANWAEGRRVRR